MACSGAESDGPDAHQVRRVWRALKGRAEPARKRPRAAAAPQIPGCLALDELLRVAALGAPRRPPCTFCDASSMGLFANMGLFASARAL